MVPRRMVAVPTFSYDVVTCSERWLPGGRSEHVRQRNENLTFEKFQ
jgi:hypothetical protein